MGGEIFLGLRYLENEKPKETLMLCWTNWLPWTIMQLSFIQQGKCFREVIDEAKKENEWPQTKLVDKVDASEYGVVLIDFINKKIFSRNHYFIPGRYNLSPHSTAFWEELQGLFDLIENNMVKEVMLLGFRNEPDVSMTPEAFKKWIIEQGEIKEQNEEGNRIHLAVEFDRHKLSEAFRGKLYEVVLADNVFDIDAPRNAFDSMPVGYDETKAWMDANGWISQIKKSTFRSPPKSKEKK